LDYPGGISLKVYFTLIKGGKIFHFWLSGKERIENPLGGLGDIWNKKHMSLGKVAKLYDSQSTRQFTWKRLALSLFGYKIQCKVAATFTQETGENEFSQKTLQTHSS
jgi:hypothetical protein